MLVYYILSHIDIHILCDKVMATVLFLPALLADILLSPFEIVLWLIWRLF